MSEDRQKMIRARTAVREAIANPSDDNLRMVAAATEDLILALDFALARGLSAEREVHRLVKERE